MCVWSNRVCVLIYDVANMSIHSDYQCNYNVVICGTPEIRSTDEIVVTSSVIHDYLSIYMIHQTVQG